MKKKQLALNREDIKKMISPWAKPYLGVADLTVAHDYIKAEHGEGLLHYPRAIVLGLPYPREIVNQLSEGPTHTYLYYYKVLNNLLDQMALTLANHLQCAGYGAFPVPASQRVGEDRLSGIFSHRLSAHLAGLGWIGKNASLIHPEVGPRLRLVSILTDCLLTADQPLDNRCGSCQACVDICPAKAISGQVFDVRKPLEDRFDAKACDEYLSKVRSSFGKRVCGKCLAVCPYGKEG